MSKYIYETVVDRFADDLKNKQVVLRYGNLDDPKDDGYAIAKRLNINSPTLVLFQINDGKAVKAKPADKMWTLAAEEVKFKDYVEQEIKSYKAAQK
ncbi:MAG: hypothetical protein LBJ21_04600 [Acidobacteriota bacterium]|jgi:hypothetical protein|nr:hypothetical protein [Acidobacteriota bacterium]